MHLPRIIVVRFLAVIMSLVPIGLSAQDSPYAPGWDLDPAGSYIRFVSTKYEEGKKIVETHSFASFTSTIAPDGLARITVKLDSVDTNNDLRNVRMRFLFFESFKFPEAIVSARLTPFMAQGVQASGSATLAIPFTFDLHGTQRQVSADVAVMAEGQDRLSVSSARPFRFRVADFGLQDNLTKIAQTAGGFQIEPEMDVIFRFDYIRRGGGGAPKQVDLAQTAPPTTSLQPVVPEPAAPEPVALETQGNFSLQECVGRFEILSETGNIYFSSGSAQLQPDSRFVLETITDIIRRCPALRIQIAGHTDSDGGAGYNRALSERRAQSVVSYLMQQGIDPRRMFSTGFGEDRPMVPNDSAFNKSRNRRIEFSLYR